MAHWWALKRILVYLKGSMTYEIHYPRAGTRNQNIAQGAVDFPSGYLSSKSAMEAVGLQSIYFSGNVDSDYANLLDDR